VPLIRRRRVGRQVSPSTHDILTLPLLEVPTRLGPVLEAATDRLGAQRSSLLHPIVRWRLRRLWRLREDVSRLRWLCEDVCRLRHLLLLLELLLLLLKAMLLRLR
jgi:hypothetical protein